MRAFGRRQSQLNPKFCDVCESYVSNNLGGAEIELTMLFADVRGSTGLAERLPPAEFTRLIGRFFTAASNVLIEADALIEKLIGDEVAAMFVPGFAGADHPRRAVEAAAAVGEVLVSQETLAAAGYRAGARESRTVDLKGRSDPLPVVALAVGDETEAVQHE
jgi:class 3 adenylate cyclase